MRVDRSEDGSRPVSTTRRGLAVLASLVVAGTAVGAVGPTLAPTATDRVAAVTSILGTTGSVAVGAARYPVPPDAIVVSPDGSDTAAGTLSAPLRTVRAAVGQARSGDTVVMRGGAYHERVLVGKRLTLQNYPGEAVWFDGSVEVTDVVRSGGGWAHDGWTTEFDASPTYTFGAPDHTQPGWRFVDPGHPMAAHPDQVWVDGVALRQVAGLPELDDGTFHVDYPNDRLHLGSDPTGKQVRASTLALALQLQAEGIVLRGVGVRRYAPSVPHMGTVTVERAGITVENVVIADNATTGLSVIARDVVLRHVTTRGNGMLGLHAATADNLTVDDLRSAGNNTERFNSAPVSGGAKIGRSRGVTVSGSTFEDNHGPGLWFDESVYDGALVNSVSQGNDSHGVSLEISAQMVVAGNLIRDNGRFGIKVNNTSEVSIWNNTLVDNDRPINIVQDDRRGTDPSLPGRDTRRPYPDPAMPWIVGPVTVSNNVLSGTTGNCMLCVEDYSEQFSAEQLRVTANGNVYRRESISRPTWLVVWSRGAGDPATFTKLTTLRRETGQEMKSLLLDGPPAVTASGAVLPEVARMSPLLAEPLPRDVAALTGQPGGTKQLGAFAALHGSAR